MRVFLTIGIFLISTSAFAQETGLTFLRIGATAREQAMANAGVASVSGAAAAYYNPARLLDGESSNLIFSQNLYIFDTYSSYAAAKFRTEKSAWGLALSWLSVRDIPIRTRPTPEPDGFFDSQNAALSLSYARGFGEKLALAITGKFIYEKLFIDDAQGYAADISATFKPTASGLLIAASLQNLGSMDALRSETTKLPTLLRAGVSYPIEHAAVGGKWLLESALETVFSGDAFLSFGAEFAYREMLWLRAGYMAGNESRNLSGGIGVRYGNLKFDYAFVPFSNELGAANLLTLQLTY